MLLFEDWSNCYPSLGYPMHQRILENSCCNYMLSCYIYHENRVTKLFLFFWVCPFNSIIPLGALECTVPVLWCHFG